MLRTAYGADPRRWAWGTLRPLVMHHPLSRKPGAAGQGAGGRSSTSARSRAAATPTSSTRRRCLPLDPLAPADNIPSLRMVLDVGAWHNSRFVLPGGQSGNPMSPHYARPVPAVAARRGGADRVHAGGGGGGDGGDADAASRQRRAEGERRRASTRPSLSSRLRQPRHPARRITSAAFWPPKPKLVETATSTRLSRASLGT